MSPPRTSESKRGSIVKHSHRRSIEKKRRASSAPQDQPRESMPLVHLNKAKGAKVGMGLTSYSETQKVVVDSLKPGSVLKDSISPGDILYSVNGTVVHNSTQASELIIAASSVSLLFIVPKARNTSAQARACDRNTLAAVSGEL